MSFWNAFSITTRYTELPHSLFSYVNPSPLNNTRWAAWNDALAQQFGFPSDPEHAPELLSVFSGESVPLLFKPLAMKYAGHQFGGYNPDLGDGRGLLLGEIKNKEGIYFDFHIKGAGQTPYSRMGDGRAVLRSTVREYLCSEAMAGLNIPTTRALGMMTSDGVVVREGYETGALLIRVTETHIRFGHFEHLFYSNLLDEHKQLADKVIEWHFPHCLNADKPYLMMFTEIVDRTAQMIAHWQAVGFSHGVMNTDNMSIIGQTFDYGPFGFLDDYEPGYICNHSDYQGRYAFNQQPRIGLWNLSALAHSLSPLIDKADLEDALTQYEDLLHRYFSKLMRGKLGLISKQDGDSRLFESMFELLSQNGADYTCFMRSISCLDRNEKQTIIDLFIDREAATLWVDLYLSRCELEERGVFERCQNMRTVNPKYILRNYLAQKAIDKAQSGDFSEVEILSMLLTNPFDEHSEFESYSQLPPEWGKKMEISCSS